MAGIGTECKPSELADPLTRSPHHCLTPAKAYKQMQSLGGRKMDAKNAWIALG